jgi:hypothetical protein
LHGEKAQCWASHRSARVEFDAIVHDRQSNPISISVEFNDNAA